MRAAALASTALDEVAAELLLHFEGRLVEHAGAVRADLLRPEEMELAQRWHREGFIEFETLGARDLGAQRRGSLTTHRVAFSEDAWTLSAVLRRRRAQAPVNAPGVRADF